MRAVREITHMNFCNALQAEAELVLDRGAHFRPGAIRSRRHALAAFGSRDFLDERIEAGALKIAGADNQERFLAVCAHPLENPINLPRYLEIHVEADLVRDFANVFGFFNWLIMTESKSMYWLCTNSDYSLLATSPETLETVFGITATQALAEFRNYIDSETFAGEPDRERFNQVVEKCAVAMS